MSTAAERGATRNQITVDYNYEKIFVRDNRYLEAEYANATGAEKTLAAGTVMGRIAATGLLLPVVSTAIDGSQYPIGILKEEVTVADGVTVPVTVGISGDVNQNAVVMDDAGDDLDSIVDGRQILDRIGADTVGVILIISTNQTYYDN